MDSFSALADQTRRQIVELLASGARPAGEISRAFGASAPAISQHLKALREAGLVRVRVDGQRRIYSLDQAGFEELDAWMNRVRRFWSERLDDLERELGDAPPPTEPRRDK